MKLRYTIVLNQKRKLEIECKQISQPGHNEILCRTLRSLVSPGTELGKISGKFYWTDLPCFLGYSNVAVIEEVGSQVKDYQPNQRIYSQIPHTSCFLVDTPSTSRFVPCLLPDCINDEEATFITLGAVAWYGIRKARLEPGSEVLVIGDGLVGLLAAQLAINAGCSQVFMAGHHSFRLLKANEIGVVTIDTTKDNLISFINDITGSKGFPTVINTAGTASSLIDSVLICRTNGRVIQLGTIAENVSLPMWEIERKEIDIIPAFQPRETIDNQIIARKLIIESMMKGNLHVKTFITHRFDFQYAFEAYNKLITERDSTLGVLFTYESIIV